MHASALWPYGNFYIILLLGTIQDATLAFQSSVSIPCHAILIQYRCKSRFSRISLYGPTVAAFIQLATNRSVQLGSHITSSMGLTNLSAF
jgi:hypothetical protein